MAEGWARKIHGDIYDVYSAGIEAHGLNPHAIKVMEQAGVDICQQQSQRIEEFANTNIDVVITVCGHADENCPTLPRNSHKLHAPFDDPPRLAKDSTSEEETLVHYRRVRDEIHTFIKQLPELLATLRDS